jgi:hypothetical protein
LLDSGFISLPVLVANYKKRQKLSLFSNVGQLCP